MSATAGAVALCIFLYRYKYLQACERLLLYFVILSFATDIITTSMAYFKMNNLLVMYVFSVLEILFYCRFYYLIISNKVVKRALIVMAVLLSLLIVADSLWIAQLNTINSVSSYAEAFVFMVIALLFFYQMIQNLPQKNILDYSLFWYNSGILIYFAGNLFLYLFLSLPHYHSKDMVNHLWIINSFLYFIYNIFIGVGAWKSSK